MNDSKASAGERALSPAVLADRAVGVVVASAAADALGAPHEFGRVVPSTVPLRMAAGGLGNWQKGEWTDDTQMALALLTPLSSGNRDMSAVEAGFTAWYRSGPSDVGNQTSSVLRSGGPLAASATRFQSRNADAAGNGGLMRIGPAALSFPGGPAKIAEYARATTALTHPHNDCLDASVLWALAIDHTIHYAPPSDEPWDFARALRRGLEHLPEAHQQRWEQLIDEACERPAQKFTPNGWVVHAFQAAVAAIVQTPVPPQPSPCRHLRQSIETAIRIGDDTDTVAAIAGALLGARWGATAVPMAWRSVLHGKRVYGQSTLHESDLELLARLAASGGKTDGRGWPGVVHMVPSYRERWPGATDPTIVDIGGARFGSIGGIEAALEDGADVVVSLCRMGTADVPADVEHHVIGLIDVEQDNPNLEYVLGEVADLIAARLAKGQRVYAHCVQAENRTPALAATLLARHHGMTPDDALASVMEAFGHSPATWISQGARSAAALPKTDDWEGADAA